MTHFATGGEFAAHIIDRCMFTIDNQVFNCDFQLVGYFVADETPAVTLYYYH